MNRQNKSNAIFFDLGETLVNFSNISESMYKILNKNLSKSINNLNEFVYLWGNSSRDFFIKNKDKEFIEIKQIHFLCLKTILNKHKLVISNKHAQKIVMDVWQDFIKNNTIYPDTKPILNQLKQSGYKVGIISDCDIDVAEGILKKHGLINFFDVKVFSGEIKSYKPNHVGFIKALKSINYVPEDAVYVGDSELDIKGAKELGFRTIIIDRGKMQSEKLGIEPNFRINKLIELPEILTNFT